jgi:hypothetical protein
VVAFGLCGAPNTFQSAMSSTLSPLSRKCILVFFYDILVYSRTLDAHVLHLQQVFELLTQDKRQVKLSKFSFAQRKIDYLEHVIFEDGAVTNPGKIEAIHQWHSPKIVKQLKSFLGLVCYYRKFVRHFGIICKPLTKLLKKQALFQWATVHEESFSTLKQALVTTHVPTLSDFTKQIQLETDVGDLGVGVVLM